LYMEESITRLKANEESNFFLCIGCTFSMPWDTTWHWLFSWVH
jgi:hypothetical protein